MAILVIWLPAIVLCHMRSTEYLAAAVHLQRLDYNTAQPTLGHATAAGTQQPQLTLSVHEGASALVESEGENRA